MDGVGNFCRGCLIQYDGPHELIQYTEKNRRQFVYITGLQVKRNDTLTFQLCKECFMNMKMSCKFKKVCRTSDKRFKNYMAMKEAGDIVDFCTFLKNSEETFRFPFMNAFSTPLQEKTVSKDDDNESTCTSIRNFMTDILKPDEIPDSEARIIREVIAEEADIMDDSLDSQWLQDDVPLDDFQLDFTLISPFSTPHSTSNDHTPSKNFNNLHKYQFTPRRPLQFEDNRSLPILTDPDYVPKYQFSPKNDDLKVEIAKVSKNKYSTEKKTTKIREETEEVMKETIEYVTDQLAAKKIVKIGEEDNLLNKTIPDTIDRNLEEALKNNMAAEFSLDDLIVSPAPFRQPAVTISTPTITNLLFGEKIDESQDCQINDISLSKIEVDPLDIVPAESTDNGIRNTKTETSSDSGVHNIIKLNFYREITNNEENNKTTENFENIKILEDAKIEEINVELENTENEENVSKIGESNLNQFGEKPIPEKKQKFFCEICKRGFVKFRGLQMHCKKIHSTLELKIKLMKNFSMCVDCGLTLETANYGRHVKSCSRKKRMKENPEEFKFQCDICKLVFKLRQNIINHLKTHMVLKTAEKTTQEKETAEQKKHVCRICGVIANSASNLYVHILRHEKKFSMHCSECNRGFYRKSDLRIHIRTHTKEKPYECTTCEKRYARLDVLNAHVRAMHTGEKRYQCNYCGAKFFSSSNLRTHKNRTKTCLMLRDPDAKTQICLKRRGPKPKKDPNIKPPLPKPKKKPKKKKKREDRDWK